MRKTPTAETVDLSPIRLPLTRCCDLGARVDAVPTFVASSPPRVGYTLKSWGCSCQSRFIDHDFRKLGHAAFVSKSA